LWDGARVGVSCGETLKELIRFLPDGKYKSLMISQLCVEVQMGGNIDETPLAVSSMLLAKCSPNPRSSAYAVQPLKSSLDRSNSSAYREYKIERNQMQNLAQALDIAIIGVGQGMPAMAETCFRNVLNKGDIADRLTNLGVMGDLCNRPFDESGNDVYEKTGEYRNYYDGIELSTLRTLVDRGKTVLAVAGGKAKSDAIKIAARRGYFNDLVTDYDTARTMLA
jgi:DNA-binding transcriptional regulator LsrR (DeoR family)